MKKREWKVRNGNDQKKWSWIALLGKNITVESFMLSHILADFVSLVIQTTILKWENMKKSKC